MALSILPVSHVDHGLSEAHTRWMLDLFADRDGFFIETVELPEDLSPLDCGIHGPIVGDEPVPESEVRYERRGDREWDSRMCDRPTRQTRQLTVIAGPHEDQSCVLYTAFGGPLAPQEPGDPGCKDVEASKAFWAQHALSAS